MRISKIIIKGFQQFNNFQLDLVNPKTGNPSDKVCFIGTNGTGKTTLLEKIINSLNKFHGYENQPNKLENQPFFAVKFSASSGDFFACHAPYSGSGWYGAPIVYYNPDLLYDLIEQYLSIIQNTQFFVATHNPIIAAQFEPYERIHLDFDDHGFVTATSGVTPIGDDPNDLLIKDFHVRSIYGKQGLQKWERFLELQRLIHSTSDINRQQELITEYLEIGNAYNFDPSK